MNVQIRENGPSCCRTAAEPDTETARAIDPVCGMAVSIVDQPLTMDHRDTSYYFCSPHCLLVFEKQKERMVPGETLLHRKNRALPIGILGFAGLLLVFVSVLVLANQTAAGVWLEVSRLWYWVLLLAAGFGLQLGLYVHIRHRIREKMAAGTTAEVAASGAVSTGSMIACCSHGLVNLLPVFGISAAAAFLARYQLSFILFGVFSNLIGVTIMFGIARKHGIEFANPLLRWLAGWNMKVVRSLLIVIGTATVLFSIIAV